jgi:hypothetical protein
LRIIVTDALGGLFAIELSTRVGRYDRDRFYRAM